MEKRFIVIPHVLARRLMGFANVVIMDMRRIGYALPHLTSLPVDLPFASPAMPKVQGQYPTLLSAETVRRFTRHRNQLFGVLKVTLSALMSAKLERKYPDALYTSPAVIDADRFATAESALRIGTR
jgi:hypothetical protein